MRPAVLAFALFGATIPSMLFAEPGPELGPQPRIAEKPLAVEFVTGGYKVHLTRPAAEKLLEQLQKLENEKEIGELLSGVAKDFNDEKISNTIEVLAIVISKETPKFRAALGDNLGERGVTVSVYGLAKGKDRPLLRALGKAILPEELQEQAKLLLAMARTQTVYWKVEGK